MKERIDAFLSHVTGEKALSENTVAAYRNDLSQLGGFLETEAARQGSGGLPLAMVDRERLGGFLLFLRERGYAPATVARKIAAVKSFFHYLHRSGEIATDPTDGLGSPEVKKSPPHAISADDVRMLFEQAQQRTAPEAVRDTAMLRVLYATGMRVTELVTLDLGDFNPDEATVTVEGRGGRQRALPLDEVTARCLADYIERARPVLARGDTGQVALFLNHRGARLTRQGFWLIMKALAKGTGRSMVVTPHTLRHSFASHRVGQGVALEQLRQLLGHASISTTQVYAQFAQPAEVVDLVAPTPIASQHGRGLRAARRAKISA